ncbi:hypothetical protein PGT21_008243 [Puccinia graminis f. sp. tritici]|uniref:Uncharacterized protein n=1 Tax=Puccinia graminis f. sp. tritici TaxID=56615 RepID=A0A5B0LHV6_PUCGR|nr:hypothetical protein PGTUg99_008953 [Puccinia graminis f. sp. tritici]KAA1065713.1 hypothetical protein PGT21_008243 [Puccinia graminis f. sp. tritici]
MWLAVATQSKKLLKEFLDASEASIRGFEKVPLSSSPVKPKSTLKKEAVPKSKARGTVKPNKAPPRTRPAIAKPNQNSNPLATPPNKRVVDQIDSMKTPEQQGNLKTSKLLFQSSKNKLISADGSIHTPAKISKHYESQILIMVELASTYLYCEEYTNASTLLSDAERFTKSLPPHTLPGVLASESLISLLYSRCFYEADDPESADSAFISAGEKWALGMEEEDDNNRNSDISPAQKVIRQTKFLRMIALASFTYSHIKEKQGDLALAIEYATRTVRLLRRASSNILWISNPPQTTASKPTQDVFSSNDCAPLPEIATEVNPHSFTVNSHPVGEITWQVAAMISAALSRVIALYINRGLPRLAEVYLNQFSTVSDQIGSHRLKVRGILIKANILTLKRQFDDAHDALKNASAMIEDRRTFELAEIYKLKCEISYKLKSFNEAKANCAELGRVLQELDSDSSLVPRPTSPLNSSRMSSQSSRGLLLSSTAPAPSLLIAAQTNSIQVLVARAMRRPEQVSQPLRLLAKMPYIIREQVFKTTLLAMLGLDDVLQNFKVDPLLGVLSEAMIVIPSTQSHPDQCKKFQDQFPQLSRSLTAMKEALTKRTVGCADIPNLYETIHVLITLKLINSIA